MHQKTAEHEQTRVLLTIKNGKVILIRHVHDDELVVFQHSCLLQKRQDMTLLHQQMKMRSKYHAIR